MTVRFRYQSPQKDSVLVRQSSDADLRGKSCSGVEYQYAFINKFTRPSEFTCFDAFEPVFDLYMEYYLSCSSE